MADKRTTKGSSRGKGRRAEPGIERETHHGHEIEIFPDDPGRRVLIDGEPFRYGEAGDEFYLEAYAYDRSASLAEVVRKFVDYRDKASANRAANANRAASAGAAAKAKGEGR